MTTDIRPKEFKYSNNICYYNSFYLPNLSADGLYLIPMINGDVIDKDEVDNGTRREGVYAGINSLITKPAGSIATALFPAMIAGLFGFDMDLKKTVNGSEVIDYANQALSAKNGLFICWFLITRILLILSFIAMWFFPLHGKEWDKEKHDLSIKHMEKQKEYEEKMLSQIEATEVK